MKVLFDHTDPFLLAHGGVQRQIESTKAALERLGVEVEFMRWWDDRQKGDLIHFFGKATSSYLSQAKVMGLPVVMTSFFSLGANRPRWKLRLQALATRALMKLAGHSNLRERLGWGRYHDCAFNVVGLRAEQFLLQRVHGVPAEKVAAVPLGVSEVFLNAGKSRSADGPLIAIGTIRDIKRSVPLAEAAREAQVPLLFVGKPYSDDSEYWKRFQRLIDDRWVKYQRHVESIEEMISLFQQARGFVIMSEYENWCLAAHETAAVGLPLLLPDLPWSRERFGDAAHYFPKGGNPAPALRQFYERCPTLPTPKVHIPSWEETARRLKEIYDQVASRR